MSQGLVSPYTSTIQSELSSRPIIQQGSNANGNWTKLLDSSGNPLMVIQSWSASTSASTFVTVTLPTAMPDATYIPLTGDNASSRVLTGTSLTADKTTTTFTLSVINIFTNTQTATTVKGSAIWVKAA